jgi:hypothetical protein
MTVTNELIDSLLADYKTPEDLISENGLLKQLTKILVKRALQAEAAQTPGLCARNNLTTTFHLSVDRYLKDSRFRFVIDRAKEQLISRVATIRVFGIHITIEA